jgi:ferredoxin
MRVEVDRDRCEGNAVCVGIAPDLFDLDDEE